MIQLMIVTDIHCQAECVPVTLKFIGEVERGTLIDSGIPELAKITDS